VAHFMKKLRKRQRNKLAITAIENRLSSITLSTLNDK